MNHQDDFRLDNFPTRLAESAGEAVGARGLVTSRPKDGALDLLLRKIIGEGKKVTLRRRDEAPIKINRPRRSLLAALNWSWMIAFLSSCLVTQTLLWL